MAYSTKDDLKHGDIRLPARLGDGSSFVEEAAEQIDSHLGHMYVTPIVIDTLTHPEYRPAKLLLKQINNLIASGRLILDLAASSESAELHAYGRQMLLEGLAALKKIEDREIVLTGATPIDTDGDGEKDPTGPMIHNEDPESLVQGFYTGGYVLPGEAFAPRFPMPYGGS